MGLAPQGEDGDYVTLFPHGAGSEGPGTKLGLAAAPAEAEPHGDDQGEYVTIFPSGHGFTAPRNGW